MLGLLAFTLRVEGENLWFFKCTTTGSSAHAGEMGKPVAAIRTASNTDFIWHALFRVLGMGKGPAGGDRLPPLRHAVGFIGPPQHAVGAGRRNDVGQMISAWPRQFGGNRIVRPVL